MKKLLLCVSLVIWGVISCRTGPEPDVGTTRRALTAPLPPVNDYSPTIALPSGGYTHIVVGVCHLPDHEEFGAAFVSASSGTVVALLRGRDPALTSRSCIFNCIRFSLCDWATARTYGNERCM